MLHAFFFERHPSDQTWRFKDFAKNYNIFSMRIEGGSWFGQKMLNCTLAILNSFPRRSLMALQTNTYAWTRSQWMVRGFNLKPLCSCERTHCWTCWFLPLSFINMQSGTKNSGEYNIYRFRWFNSEPLIQVLVHPRPTGHNFAKQTTNETHKSSHGPLRIKQGLSLNRILTRRCNDISCLGILRKFRSRKLKPSVLFLQDKNRHPNKVKVVIYLQIIPWENCGCFFFHINSLTLWRPPANTEKRHFLTKSAFGAGFWPISMKIDKNETLRAYLFSCGLNGVNLLVFCACE